MLRVVNSVLRAGSKPTQWRQCMKISSSKAAYFAAAAPEPQTNPDILYTGVSIVFFCDIFFLRKLSSNY